MKYCYLQSEKKLSITKIIILTAALLFSPSKILADCHNNFVSLEVAGAYLKENPYIIADYGNAEGQSSCLFKVEKVYKDDDRITISGPVILLWKDNNYSQRTYSLPDSGQIFTDELCGNYHLGYYRPMRAAFPLEVLLGPTGGSSSYGSVFLSFPDPEVIPGVDKSYSGWTELLPAVIRDYCLWWHEKAEVGPPVFHDLIDSVLSAPEGGCKKPPLLYVDYNLCPGEGCQYGEWTTSGPVSIFDKPNGTRKTGELQPGESFTAITGNVYLTPLEKIADEPIEVYDSTGSFMLEPGRKYYILSGIGEGQSRVWVNGRIMTASESEYNSSQKWWVEIITKNRKKGWILYPENGSISGSDYLE